MKMKSQRLLSSELAGIQYLGLSGITLSCIKAITLLINGGELIKHAFLISCDTNHAFLLANEYDDVIAVKDGFSSGYSGEGPRGLASALMLLYRHNVEIEEYTVDVLFMERLGYSCLLQSDLDSIRNQNPVRPNRWYDYVHDQGRDLDIPGKHLSRHYPLAIPFGIIDERIIDLAVNFHENADTAIISAYRRLEDTLRTRTGLTGESTKLFSKAFLSDDSPLRWDVPDEGELKGRANLFIATFMAFRNARAHREIEGGSDTELREFLLVNELYRLEAEAMTEAELKKKDG
ncbi:MAG: hypothetical protein NVS3B3_03300 [Aquirhabdus sp.]